MNRRSMIRRISPGLALAALLAFGATAANAQDHWPTKPVKFVVGFPPGGTTDVMARVLAQAMSESLGQTIVVENKAGVAGNIATGEVVKAEPDGYTVLIAPTSAETANPSLYKMNFHPAKDLLPVSAIGRTAMYLVARPTLPVKNAAELVAMAKANPGTLTYASGGPGTPLHLTGELFKQQANIFVTHIPYRGAIPALQDVMAGQVDYLFDPGIAFPHIRTGKVKLLGVASSKRSPFMPDAPTLAEQGIQGVEFDLWFGIWVPLGTPASVIDRLNRESAKALARPIVKERFAAIGAEVAPLDTAAFKKLLIDEGRTLSKLIQDRKIGAD